MVTSDSVPNTSPALAGPPPLPLACGRIGVTDVERIEDANRALRAVDYQYGGGACHDTVAGYLPRAMRMLGVDATGLVMDRLCVAVADLHNVAGWASFDIGQVRVAHLYFARALKLAEQGNSYALVANIRYRRGRVHLHHNAPDKALMEFQLGQVAAQACGSALAVAILCANQAWAYAKMGRDDQALALLGRSSDEFTRADLAEAPAWARFFTETDMVAMVGTVYTELALTVDSAHTRLAIPALCTVVNGYGPDMTRSRSFNLISLATNHLLDGDVDQAATVGGQAVAVCERVKTTRTKDRLRPLQREADKRRNNADARALSTRIVTFTATRPGCCWASSVPLSQPCTPSCGSPCQRVWRPPIAVGPGLSPHRQERAQLRGSSSPDTGGPGVGRIRRRPSVRKGAMAAVDPAVKVLAAINELASAEGVPVAAHHVCVACAAAVQASGVSLYLLGEPGLCEPLYVTNSVSEQIAELQVMLGEGPSTEALGHDHPVLTPALGSNASMQRWPAFAPAAVATGVSAVFAFPLMMGAISVGVLEIYRGRQGELSAPELAEALLFADAALARVLNHLSGPDTVDGPDLLSSGFEYHWAEVHQATGIISVQLNSDLTVAFLRLRAHAYLTGRRLSQVASDVVERRLRFDPNADNAGAAGSGG